MKLTGENYTNRFCNLLIIRDTAAMRFLHLIILMLVMSSCSREKPDSVFMNGLPELGFTIDYACFLNQDSAIIIGRHKEYNDSFPTQYSNSVEIYVSNNKGRRWSLKSKIPFNDLIHSNNTIKSDAGLFTSLFLQNGDAYLLNTKYNPKYSAKLVYTGKTRYLPIAVKDGLLYSTTSEGNEFTLIAMDSVFHVLNRLPSPHLSQGVFLKNELFAIRRHAINNNIFVHDKQGHWNSYTCPINPSFIAELKDEICIAGNNQSNDMELYSFAQSEHNPQLLYSSNNYTFVKDLVTDRLNTIVLVLGYETGIFMSYKLIVSNNSGKDWKTFDIPNSVSYTACSIYGNVIYLFLTNNSLIQYRIS